MTKMVNRKELPMKVTEKELKLSLIETYVSTFQEARKTMDDKYVQGRNYGMNEATSAICLLVFGGEKMMRMWELCMHHDENEKWQNIAEEIKKEVFEGDA